MIPSEQNNAPLTLSIVATIEDIFMNLLSAYLVVEPINKP